MHVTCVTRALFMRVPRQRSRATECCLLWNPAWLFLAPCKAVWLSKMSYIAHGAWHMPSNIQPITPYECKKCHIVFSYVGLQVVNRMYSCNYIYVAQTKLISYQRIAFTVLQPVTLIDVLPPYNMCEFWSLVYLTCVMVWQDTNRCMVNILSLLPAYTRVLGIQCKLIVAVCCLFITVMLTVINTQAGMHTYIQTGRQIRRQTDWQIDRQLDR